MLCRAEQVSPHVPASQEMWRQEHGWRGHTPRGALVLKKCKTKQLAALLLHPRGRAPVLDPTLPVVHGDSPAWVAPHSRESFGAVKNHFPKNITALLALEGLKALQKINGRAHRVLLGGIWQKQRQSLAEGGSLQPGMWLCVALDRVFCTIRGWRVPSTQCNPWSARRGRSPRPLTLNPENYDFMTFFFFFFLS